MTEVTHDIINRIFPPKQREEVSDLLNLECGKNLPFSETSTEQGLERVRFSVLKLSGGNLDDLYYWVEQAQTDSRDVLMAAGFGHSVLEHKRWAEQRLAAA